VKIAVNHNLDTDGYFLTGDVTRGAFCPQNREIAVTLEFDWCDQATTIWDLAEAGQAFGLKVPILKTANLGVEIYLPALFISPFPFPDIAGDKS
jgi:hypothetical protein